MLMNAHGSSKKLIETHSCSWKLTEAYRSWWKMMEAHRNWQNLMEADMSLWKLMEPDKCSMEAHVRSQKLIVTHGSWWKLIEADRSSNGAWGFCGISPPFLLGPLTQTSHGVSPWSCVLFYTHECMRGNWKREGKLELENIESLRKKI